VCRLNSAHSRIGPTKEIARLPPGADENYLYLIFFAPEGDFTCPWKGNENTAGKAFLSYTSFPAKEPRRRSQVCAFRSVGPRKLDRTGNGDVLRAIFSSQVLKDSLL